jgi:quinol monooxygenase YgiN
VYGLIGKVRARSGQRDAPASILLEGTSGMPGCLSYVVAIDPDDPEVLWITDT